jgi:hypothetical protein
MWNAQGAANRGGRIDLGEGGELTVVDSERHLRTSPPRERDGIHAARQ